ncbi:type II toxin-antitoxin system RelE/ParE family toxin [Patescibacteria group bacterium]|nr:type II toxin-antitoxin system RelE/ParE family toxin [Patescibacteria group bacterium]
MEVFKTDLFDKWLKKLRDKRAKAIIQVHINRIIENKLGKLNSVGDKIHEKKINYGPGYRLYFINHGKNIIILLCGGDKSTQQQDISQAKTIAIKIKMKE